MKNRMLFQISYMYEGFIIQTKVISLAVSIFNHAGEISRYITSQALGFYG